jgi:hypothetical protein
MNRPGSVTAIRLWRRRSGVIRDITPKARREKRVSLASMQTC